MSLLSFLFPFHPVLSTEADIVGSFHVDLNTPAKVLILSGARLNFLPVVRRGGEGEAGPPDWLLQPQLQPPD